MAAYAKLQYLYRNTSTVRLGVGSESLYTVETMLVGGHQLSLNQKYFWHEAPVSCHTKTHYKPTRKELKINTLQPEVQYTWSKHNFLFIKYKQLDVSDDIHSQYDVQVTVHDDKFL